MKVALVIFRYAPEGGGAERAAANLARGLHRDGHEVHVFANTFGDTQEVIPHPVSIANWRPGGRHLSFATNVQNLLLRERFDVIHSFTRTILQDILRIGGGSHREYLRQTAIERPRLLQWWTWLNPKERAILDLERRSFKPSASRLIVSVSNRCKEEIVHDYGVDPNRVDVIYNGVDTEAFHPKNRTLRKHIRKELGRNEDDYLALFCGTGFRRKGLRYAIEAVAETRSFLTVVGSGTPAPYRRLAQNRGIEDRIQFLGPRTDVAALYAAADVLLLPSLYDPFPNACLEAMSSGLPVIMTKITGVAEIVQDGTDAFVLEHGSNVEDMADRLHRLQEKDLRDAMGSKARATAERFTIERNVRENLALYKKVLAQRAAAPVG